MATLIGDHYASDHSRFHTMMPSYQQQTQQSHHRSSSHSRDDTTRHSSSSPTSRRARSSRTPGQSATLSRSPISKESQQRREREIALATADSITSASRFPTPPDSSSPGSSASASNSTVALPQTSTQTEQNEVYMADSSSASSTHTVIPPSSTTQRPPHSIPSPASDRNLAWTPANAGSPHTTAALTGSPTQKVVHVTDLAHIQRLAETDALGGTGPGVLDDPSLQEMKYEISAMPIGDIIEMVSALLHKITTTNDTQHDALTRNVTHQRQAQAQNEGGSDAHSSPFSTSVLAFHGKNVPAITILSYLTRIHKYCPTTYEVFLSLLVYFDRMTERVNERVMKDEETKRQNVKTTPATPAAQDTAMAEADAGDEVDEDLADSDDEDSEPKAPAPEAPVEPAMDAATSAATYFVVDSFNIHRLIIAGVTCASKFFSDVFYTNSRYAKVGGLPLPELNHLELQFLLLNDFRLAVPVEDLERYATMLVEFYAREVVAQRSGTASSS